MGQNVAKCDCKRKIGIFEGTYTAQDGSRRYRAFAIPCNSWSCPECRETKARALWARAMTGELVKIAERDGFRHEYQIKLLTLTVPGADYRESHTPREAWQDIAKAFDKLVKSLKSSHGKFEYVKVYELQRDGFPHLHVLMAGKAIAPADVLGRIKDLWCRRYGMGFVKINVLKKGDQGIKGALSYVLKYMFKAFTEGKEEMKEFKGKRRFSTSREVIGKDEKTGRDWIHHKIEFAPVGRFFGVEFGEVCLAGDEAGLVDVGLDEFGPARYPVKACDYRR